MTKGTWHMEVNSTVHAVALDSESVFPPPTPTMHLGRGPRVPAVENTLSVVRGAARCTPHVACMP
jgi:hypothetical protein